MSSKPQRSIRLEKRSARSLAVLSGAPGEIFFDNDNGTLRVYTDTTGDSIILANRQWVFDNTFSGNFNDLTNVPNLATQDYVNAAIAGVPIADLTGLATETYVDTEISTALGSLAPTTLETLTDVSYTGALQTNDVLTWNGTGWANSPAQVDLSSYYTSTETDTAISTAISNFQTTIVDAAPAALDTLNELAAALGDDANFATTVTNSIALKAPLASPTFTGTITAESLGFAAGATINEFSTDSTLADNSTTAVPTESAVKTYVDTSLAGKEPTIAAGLSSQYWRGNKSWATLNSSAVGLGNVTNESKTTMFTNPSFIGFVTMPTQTEIFYSPLVGATVGHDLGTSSVYYYTPVQDFTANFLSAPTTNDRTISVALILAQGATAYMPTAVQIDNVGQTLLWQGGIAPARTANGIDIVSFTLIRRSDAWTVIGSATSYS